MRFISEFSGLFASAAVACCVISACAAMSGRAAANASRVSDDLWSRTKRVFMWDEPHRARYPAIARTERGELIVLFTSVTQEEEEAGRGELKVIRSADDGQTWSQAHSVYSGETGQPRATGSLTRLASNDLLAVVSEMDKQERPTSVRLVTSKDNGHNWQIGKPLTFDGLAKDAWLCPHGQLIEKTDGSLMMSVYGPDLNGHSKQSVALLRSLDGGRTWRDLSIIAADESRDFTHATILPTGGENMMAMFASGEALYRAFSDDNGRTWGAAEQVLTGRDPYLFRIDDHTLACLASIGSGWSTIRIAFSYDGGLSWRCDRKVMEHPGEPGGHFGWAAGAALDDKNVAVVFGRTQRPLRSQDGPDAPAPKSAEAERIEFVHFRRDEPTSDSTGGLEPIALSRRDQWKPSGSISASDFPVGFSRLPNGEVIGAKQEGDSMVKVWNGPGRNGASAAKYIAGPPTPRFVVRSTNEGKSWTKEPMNLPHGHGGSPRIVMRSSSGRLFCTMVEWLLVEWNYEDKKVIGHENGYAIWSVNKHSFHHNRLAVLYSDDDGKTWKGTEHDINFSPFFWAIPNDPMFELSDGTIILPIWGNLTVDDGWRRHDATAVIRSTDGGKTWGDVSIMAHDKEPGRSAYNETGVAVINDEIWIAFMRTEYHDIGNEGAWMSRTVTRDRGYTWSEPELCFAGGVPQVVVLPDGGIAVGASGGLHWTYDYGRTWTRVGPQGGYVHPMLLDDDTMLIGNGQSWGSLSVYKRKAAGPR